MLQRNGRLLYKRFAEYFIPTVLMAVALSMSIVVDGIIVGNMLGPEALAAVNLGSPLITVYSVVFSLFGIGGSILVAFYKGRRDNAAANAVFSASLVCIVLTSLMFVVAGSLFREELAALLSGNNAALYGPVLGFITPLVYGCPLLMLVPGLVYFIRTDGRPKLAALALIVANVVNLACDVAFIAIMQDIRAAAIATVTGYAVGSCVFIAYARSQQRSLHFVRVNNMISLAAAVAKAGLPSGVTMLFTFVKIFFINRLVLSLAGESGMVAFSICISCWSLASMFIAGASQTMMPMIGVLNGEGDFQGMRFVFKRALTVLLSSTVVLVLLLELFPGGLLRFFGVSDAGQLALGIPAVRLFALCLVGMAFTFLMLYYTQTVRRQSMAMAISAIEGAAVVVPAAWLLSGLMGLSGVWLAFSVAEIAAICAIFFMSRHVCKSSGGTLKGLLMLPERAGNMQAFDVTIKNLLQEAVTLSDAVIAYCREKGLDAPSATRIGLAVEEMAVNTVKHGGGRPGKHFIDVTVALTEGQALISFRDDGVPFNPAEYGPGADAPAGPSGITLIRKIASSLEYAYTLGFNTTVIVVKTPVQVTPAAEEHAVSPALAP